MRIYCHPSIVMIALTVVATAYCTCPICTAPYNDGFLPDGETEPEEGRTIAGPPSWPIGTVVYIPGMGTRIVEDRGGDITAGRIDIYYDSHQDALTFGRQTLRIYILSWGD